MFPIFLCADPHMEICATRAEEVSRQGGAWAALAADMGEIYRIKEVNVMRIARIKRLPGRLKKKAPWVCKKMEVHVKDFLLYPLPEDKGA